MHTNSTAQAIVQVRGPTVTYTILKFTPIVDSRAYAFDIDGFTIRRGSERYTLDDLPVSRALTETAFDDILYRTFEADEDERAAYVEIDFEIPEYDESVRIHFRMVESDKYPEALFCEVEDGAGDWLPVEDVLLSELLTESFRQTLETSVVSQINDHTLDLLPLAAE